MRKNPTLFILIFLFIQSKAQEVLVPYRVGDLFGLSDLKGNLKVNADYDALEWMGEDYFMFVKKPAEIRNMPKDAIWDGNGVERGVIKAGKVIISNGKFQHYYRYQGHFIAGSNNFMRPEDCMLYKLDGTPVFSKQIQGSTQIEYFSELKHLWGLDKRYVLITTSERVVGLSHERKWAFWVYDTLENAIAERLFGMAEELEFFKVGRKSDSVGVSFLDSLNKRAHKFLRYNRKLKKYELINATTPHIRKDELEKYGTEHYSERGVVSSDYYGEEHVERIYERKKDKKRFAVWKDSAFYGEKRIEISGASFIKAQYFYPQPPVIYEMNRKFGIASSDNKWTDAIYDTLNYLSGTSSDTVPHYYLAGIKEKDKFKFGIIESNGKVLIPVVYDSLTFQMPELKYHIDGRSKTYSFHISFEPDEDRYTHRKALRVHAYRDIIMAYSNGKVGVLNIKNENIFNVSYDTICRNALNYGSSYRIKMVGNFAVFKRDGKLGIVTGILKDPAILFSCPGFPAYYYPDYYGMEGLKIFSIMGPSGFICFGTDRGTLFLEQKK